MSTTGKRAPASGNAADARIVRELFEGIASKGVIPAAVTVGSVSIAFHAPDPFRGVERSASMTRVGSTITAIGGQTDEDARRDIMREYGGDAIDSLIERDDDEDEDVEAITQ